MGSKRTERAASQEHFIDLCRMLEVSTPNEADPTGTWYAFEKGTEKLDGGGGFADVWKKDHFAWEYKGKHKSLKDAYRQLLQYRESLLNPPLLVVCDLERFEVHTNFTGTKKIIYTFDLSDLRTAPTEPLRVLRAVMRDPESLRPKVTREQITEEAAKQFATLAGQLRKRGHEPNEVARFLNRLLFCLFAEDAELLPKGLLGRILQSTKGAPEQAIALIREVFGKMAKKGGGYFGAEEIQWFNGGLFENDHVLPLSEDDLGILKRVSELDWSSVEPAILGTLFERGLDPNKRSQLGAHYTDKDSILRVIEPVVLLPLRREFEAMKVKIERLLAKGKRATPQAKGVENPNRIFRAFLSRLRSVRILDPACGSGNFLYIALRLLKDLEKEVIMWGAQALRTTHEFPQVGPQVVHGIEINAYAAELARVTVWIGEIQWMISNGFGYQRNPILKPLETIECRDAILDTFQPDNPKIAEWPSSDFVVGNPPFLGIRRMRRELGDDYVNKLYLAWNRRVPRAAELVTYWHERARDLIAQGKLSRAGLLATQGIRGGANLTVLKKIKESGDIFMAWSDEPWVVEGADVRVSIIAQDNGTEKERFLDGKPVDVIHADLTGGAKGTKDFTEVHRLLENIGVAFMGDSKGGKFNIPRKVAAEFLRAPTNVNGRTNGEVIKPWVNGKDVTGRPRDMYIIDFGLDMNEKDAAQFELPFKYIEKNILPKRLKNKRDAYRKRYWIHVEPRPALRAKIKPLKRFIATVRHTKYRLFVWLEPPVLPDSALIVIARDDWYAFGVLHSKIHEAWALRKGTKLEDRPRYTPTSTFETFPFPWPLNTPEGQLTAKQRKHRDAIGMAAESLEKQRRRWLQPVELVTIQPPLAPGMPAVPQAKDPAAASQLATRTLTDLYNLMPTWLKNAHQDLDRAVLEAYGWPEGSSKEDILNRLLALNYERPAANPLDDGEDDKESDEDEEE